MKGLKSWRVHLSEDIGCILIDLTFCDGRQERISLGLAEAECLGYLVLGAAKAGHDMRGPPR